MVFRHIRLSLVLWLGACLPDPTMAGEAASSPIEKWGALLEDVARLTWAEQHCRGRASDGVRELRLYFRKSAPHDFGEAIVRDRADASELVDPGTDERTSTEGHCLGVNLVFGARGSRLPGLWQVDRSSKEQVTSRQVPLSRYGEFVQALAEIDFLKSICKGTATELADEFIDVFRKAGGAAEFRKLVEDDIRFLHAPYQDGTCSRLDATFGESQQQWPVLWSGRGLRRDPRDAEASDTISEGDGSTPSNFVLVKLPQGIELELPRGWRLLGSELYEVIDAAAEAALDLADAKLPGDINGKQTLLVANSSPRSTYAAIRINSMDPLLTPEEFMSVAGNEKAEAAIKLALTQQENQLLEFKSMRTEEASGLPTLVIEYRRSGSKGPVHVQINRLLTSAREISIILSYRESEAVMWKPTIERIRKTIVVRE